MVKTKQKTTKNVLNWKRSEQCQEGKLQYNTETHNRKYFQLIRNENIGRYKGAAESMREKT